MPRKSVKSVKIVKPESLSVESVQKWVESHSNAMQLVAGTVVLLTIGALLIKNVRSGNNKPQISEQAVSAESITPAEEANETGAELTAPVKEFPDTTGVYSYVVENGDSYARISQKTCGTQASFRSLKLQNQSRSLQPGATVKFVCN